MSTRIKRALALGVLTPALLLPAAGVASAGTTWNSIGGVAVTETQNGVTWKSISPAGQVSYDHGRRHIVGDEGGKRKTNPVRDWFCSKVSFC